MPDLLERKAIVTINDEQELWRAAREVFVQAGMTGAQIVASLGTLSAPNVANCLQALIDPAERYCVVDPTV